MYSITGYGSKGSIKVKRKFEEFEALRSALTRRLPGVYIPKLPKGTFFGMKDIDFLQERAFHLD